MTHIDITPYIHENGFVNLEKLLKDYGYVRREDILSVRIDTAAIAQILRTTPKTLCKFVNDGLVELDNSRRMTLGDALSLDFKELQRHARIREPFRIKKQKRNFKK